MGNAPRTRLFYSTWPFSLLCLLTASRWISADQWPRTGSTLRSEAVACALTATLILVISRLRSRGKRTPEPKAEYLLYAALFGFALLALPSLGAALTGVASEPFNRTAAMCFVPLTAAICTGIRSGNGMTGLGAPLAGVTGALFLFPLALPVDTSGWSGLIVPPLVVGIACGLRTERLPMPPSFLVAFSFGGALGLAMIEALRAVLSHEPAGSLSLIAVALDLVAVACSLISLRRLGTERYSTRYLVVPAITVLEGMLIFRPGFSLRVWTGLGLILGAAVVFWRQCSVEEEPTAMPI